MAQHLISCLPKRLTRRTKLFGLVVFLVTLFTVFIDNSIDNDEEWYKHPEVYFKEVTCEIDDYTMKLFNELTLKLKQVLDKLELKYFLCYGSLWGALKFHSTLPWDRNIDICIVYHELANLNEQIMHQTFKSYELSYFYNSRRGKYVISYKGVSAELTVFEKVGHHMERVGWEKRFFPHLYLNFQNFPYQLIEKEMKKLEFNSILMPVPHQEYELQKYLYPENWWKEVKPKGCY